MKTRFLTFLMLLFVCSAFAEDPPFPHPDFHFPAPVQSSDGMNGTCVALIYLDGVQVETEAELEVAFFDEEGNCRGRDFVHDWVAPNGYDYGYQFQSVMYGEAGQTLTFKFYNHDTELSSEDLGYECVTYFIYQPNVEFGELTNPEHVYFASIPITCTFSNHNENYNWSYAANWSPRMPASFDDAIITANSICVIDEDSFGISYNTLTIKDGAQFVGDGENYEVIFEKEIVAYTPNTRNNYYFIASPIEDGEIYQAENIFYGGNFDLYFWDANGLSEDEEEIMEWQNYESDMYQEPEDFYTADFGYLYANTQNVTLKFSGIANSAETKDYTRLTNTGENFPGFHLVGNPLATNARVSQGTSVSEIFYTMNELRNEVISVINPIVAPCTAIFAVANGSTASQRKVTFTQDYESELNTRSTTSLINIEVSNNENLLDRAYVRFNEQDNLQKFTLNPEATHVFFREEGKDFAAIQGSERMSQLPLYFETREYGTYTINVKLENMNCEYLHLIDNLTGMDIDLNTTPSYTFQANSSDYAARFKLVFEGTGVEENNANVNFAIVEGNRVIIPMIEHESTLEIIDMTGRTISSQKVNGSFDQTLNVKAGIYLLRMNGNVQKIVVR